MKYLILVTFACFMAFLSKAQETDTLPDTGHEWPTGKNEKLDGGDVLMFVDKMPEYPGGIQKLDNFIQKHITDSLRKEEASVFVRCIN